MLSLTGGGEAAERRWCQGRPGKGRKSAGAGLEAGARGEDGVLKLRAGCSDRPTMEDPLGCGGGECLAAAAEGTGESGDANGGAARLWWITKGWRRRRAAETQEGMGDGTVRR
eukprot:CAMPEP_0174912622 /NCGR_PEP_ID=MMETSP0167-20121228/79875_1 /TAXON_ID=38298 /ORGANISM="Rhodella maculata, Strain CCMP736" /LENGTH=112 /DNA_ID=CAMNT_0016157281 /DNA_START=1985 /DNA_END=2319 /DNA_ORIENTATION=+